MDSVLFFLMFQLFFKASDNTEINTQSIHEENVKITMSKHIKLEKQIKFNFDQNKKEPTSIVLYITISDVQ